MFRRQENTLDPDAKYPANIRKLGYFIDNRGCIRNIEAPENFFDFFYTNNDRHNEVRGEAMRVCQRREVMKRLAALGLKELYLPTLSTSKPDGPHVPILAPAAHVLKTRKRVIVIINDDTYQDLGILAYRELQREGGLNGGSVIDFVKGLVSRTQSSADPGIKEKLAQDGARIEDENHVPGLIVLNTAQLLYSHKFNKALSMRSWHALPRKSITHDAVKVHEVENRVEGHRTPQEHIKTVFDTVINNPDFVSPEAEVYVVAIENGAEKLLGVLSEDFYRNAQRITALAIIQSTMSGHQIHNPDMKAFLYTRVRQWELVGLDMNNPTQCNALPPDYSSNATSRKPDYEESIDWLEQAAEEVGHRATTPFANIPEAKAALVAAPDTVFEDGFLDPVPICPTFGGGETWVGECIFTQPVVQHAILSFFEEVARDPEGFCNPEFDLDDAKPSPDKPLTLTADSQHDSLPREMMNPEQSALSEAEEELAQLKAALWATPTDEAELAPGRSRLQARISKKEKQVKELEEKALAGGGLGAGAAQDVRNGWETKTNGEKWTEQKPGAPIGFAGVKVDSNVVRSAGLLGTAEEELAKLEVDDETGNE